MQVFYTSDGEPDSTMTLNELLANFITNNTPHNADDIRDALTDPTRGWFTGTHDCGQYLVLNFHKFALMPDALDAHYAPKEKCRHRDDGRGFCIDCGEPI
jgi:hypothetical protein